MPTMQNQRQSARPRPVAFSIVEIVFSLVILALLTSITITLFNENSQQARGDSALSRLSTLAKALQRWELERRRDYPYPSLGPLVGTYVDRVGQDPWGNPYGLDLQRGFVYSWGPNGVDELGEADDIRYPFRAPRITDLGASIVAGKQVESSTAPVDILLVPPSPPTNLTFNLAQKKIFWSPPTTFADGKPLSATTHLSGYRVYFRNSSGEDVLAPGGTITSPSTKEFTVSAGSNQTQVLTVRAFYEALSGALVESSPSNQAGIYFPENVGPVITLFEPSTFSPPIGSDRLSFRFEVFDSDSNLDRVELEFGNRTFEAWRATAGSNKFRVFKSSYRPSADDSPPSGGFSLTTTGPVGTVTLSATDDPSSGGSLQTTSVVLTEDIIVTNTPPTIISFKPDKTSIIRGTNSPSFLTTITVTVDAQDLESNLTKLTLERLDNNDIESATFPDGVANASLSGSFLVNTTGPAVQFQVSARDATGAVSSRPADTISIAADETPPETAVVNLNPSNPYLASHPIRCESNDETALGVNNWFITDPENITATWSSFEAETPPIHYRIAIATTPPRSWTTDTVPGAITKDPEDNGPWVAPTPDDTVESYTLSRAKGELTTAFEEGVRYYMGVQAVNSANPPIANGTFAQPRNPITGCLQNGFVLDKTPPTVGALVVDTPSLCTGFVPTVINGLNGLSASWPSAVDNQDGSGLSSFAYQVTAQPPVGPPALLYDVLEFRPTEINNLALGSRDANTVTLSVRARDAAGNLSETSSTIDLLVDSTPAFAIKAPEITNLTQGVITDPNRFEGSWRDVFVDNEQAALPLSYEWGISTTFPIRGIPDRSPGGWQVAGVAESGALDQPGLLAIGDTVYLVVRATNCANSTSIETYSAPAVVSSDFFARVVATPSLGFKDLAVDFDLNVIGGDPPYQFSFDFGEPLASDPTRPSTASCPATNGVSCQASFTYTQVGSHVCLGTVETASGTRTRAFATIQVLPQPYVMVLGNSSLSLIDLGKSPPTQLQLPLQPAGSKANRLKLIEISDSVKFALFTATGPAGTPAGVYRFDLDAARATPIETAPDRDNATDLFISSDNQTVMVTNDKGGPASLRRLRLDPSLNYATVRDTPLSMTPGSPIVGTGSPSMVVIASDNANAIAVDRDGPAVAFVAGLGAGQPGVTSTSPLALTTPGFGDITSDGTLLAITDRGAPNLLLTTVTQDAGGGPAFQGTRIVNLAGMNSGDVEFAPDRKLAYVLEAAGNRMARVDVSTAQTLDTTQFTQGLIAGADLSRDGTLMVIGDTTGTGVVRLIKTAAYREVLSVPVLDGVVDVAFFERPNFGLPVITRLLGPDGTLSADGTLAATSGQAVEVLGYNLGPDDSDLKVTLISVASSVPPSAAAVISGAPGTNGFNRVRFTLPVGYPPGDVNILVSTGQGSSQQSLGSRMRVQ